MQAGGSQAGDFSQCRTGADANRDAQCRVIGTVNSVQAYWATELPRHGTAYSPANTVLYSGSTQSRCGTASNQVGPFYCPLDRKVYIDASFFNELTSRFGADDGALAQEYVVAHEYGHHVQDLLGVLDAAQSDPQGAESGAVRVELMADCLAGVWARHATETKDAQGDAFLAPLTQKDIASALSAASAVGDDRIQRAAQGRVDPGVVDARVERAAPEVVHDRLPERRPRLLRHAARGDALTTPRQRSRARGSTPRRSFLRTPRLR